MTKIYNYRDLINSFKKVGVSKGKTVLVKADLRLLGPFEKADKKIVLESYFNALSELVDLAEGTLVVSTASHKLINTDITFDLKSTPSENGIFTEYIRQKNESFRSFHPFDSYTAIGKNAKQICEDVSMHAYGLETPKARLIDLNALCITIGLQPRLCSSIPHHIEMLMGVPYRYTKEYIHPVMRNNKISYEPFYRLVWYIKCGLKRNKNLKIFNHFSESGHTIKNACLGRGHIYSFSMSDFYKTTIQLFKKDLYAWLDEEPETKPYQ